MSHNREAVRLPKRTEMFEVPDLAPDPGDTFGPEVDVVPRRMPYDPTMRVRLELAAQKLHLSPEVARRLWERGAIHGARRQGGLVWTPVRALAQAATDAGYFDRGRAR